ncbi:hypothetical protein IWW36_003062 [Coemansia brasiliensis]|uniref:SURP motif domain-containing protein n=1 Tax=Coemansia brasiliensis TaxID=2650707 RepID=A0A9W8M0E8_9FUNG|nr:hypothetical protein IWW36_003062 [Coemansia brasiliensis]
MNASVARQRMRRERLASGSHSQQAQLHDDEQEHKAVVFGYSAKIHQPLDTYDSKARLIELENNSQTAVLVDRYDARHLLLEPYTATNQLTNLSDPYLHTKRFGMLSNASIPESELFQMDPTKRRMYIENIEVVGKPDDSGASEKSETDSSGGSSSDEKGEEFRPNFAVPSDMKLPQSKRHFEIIERTAKLIAQQQSSERARQMEILVQGKQATNRDFDFLNRSSSLYPFYRHLVWLLTTNLAAYDSDESSSSQDNTDNPAIVVPHDLRVPKDPKQLHLINTVARWVAKSSSNLECKIKTEKGNDPAYSFLALGSQHNKYYCFRRNCLADGMEDADIDKAVASCTASTPSPSNDDIQAKRRLRAQQFLQNKKSRQNE